MRKWMQQPSVETHQPKQKRNGANLPSGAGRGRNECGNPLPKSSHPAEEKLSKTCREMLKEDKMDAATTTEEQ